MRKSVETPWKGQKNTQATSFWVLPAQRIPVKNTVPYSMPELETVDKITLEF